MFYLFSVIDGSRWFWWELFASVSSKFLKASFLVSYLSYYTSMTFLMMLSVILLPLLMISLFILQVNRCLLCGNSWIWLLKHYSYRLHDFSPRCYKDAYLNSSFPRICRLFLSYDLISCKSRVNRHLLC